MRTFGALLGLLVLLTLAAPARAGDEAERLKAWSDRIARELKELEGRVSALGSQGDAASADTQAEKDLARILLQLTQRIAALEKRIQALEAGAPADAKEPTAPTAPGAKGPVAAAGGKTPGAPTPEAAPAGDRPPPAYLKDPVVAEHVPAPPKESKVKIVQGKGGIRKGVIALPEGMARGPYGKLGCRPAGEIFLLQDAPVIGLELTIQNRLGYLFAEEESVFLRMDGVTVESKMKWHGSTVQKADHVLYVETLNFGIGLRDFLQLLRSMRVTVLVGACEFEIDRICMAGLRDLGSVLHPDRVNAIR